MTLNKENANIYLVVVVLSLFIIFSLVTLYFMQENISNRSSVHIKNEKLLKLNIKN